MHLPGPRENREPQQIVRQILQPDLGPGSQETNGANQFPPYRGHRMPTDMFDAGENPRAASIGTSAVSGEGLVTRSFIVNLGAQAIGLQLCFDRF